jgi:acyl-coenzyme A synthetase/AMP-(fatty) acid ligase
VETLPKTLSGKIKRNELRDREMKKSLNETHVVKKV